MADNYRKLTYLCSAQVFAFLRGGSMMGSRTEAQLGDDEATAKVAELTVIERIKAAAVRYHLDLGIVAVLYVSASPISERNKCVSRE